MGNIREMLTSYSKGSVGRALPWEAAITLASSVASSASKAGFEPIPEWMKLLYESEKGNRNYRPRVEGEIPKNLRGTLYRNGPGLFERGGIRVKHLLDGDGLIQKLTFSDQGPHYRNAFVRTKKFEQEEKSGKREFSTWTTRKSTNMFSNLGGGITESQAGVTVYPVHGKVLARDEIGPSYELDPETIETIGTIPVGRDLESVMFKAHMKFDPSNNECVLAGVKFGPKMKIHVSIYEPNLKLKTQFSFVSPRQVYFHDFMLSKNYVLFNLHPCFFSPFPFLLGMKSFIESLKWEKKHSNLIAVLPRDGGKPTYFEAPGSFMWHALNTYEQGHEIIADFVSYEQPDHFIAHNPLLGNIVKGYMGNAQYPGKIRRYVINMNSGRMKEEIIDHQGSEFPMIDLRQTASKHNVGYFTYSGDQSYFHSGLKRVDYGRSKIEKFDFGSKVQVSEPVFCPKPGGQIDEGWLLAQCVDGNTKTSFYALFEAKNLGKGPLAKIWLDHHVPMSFHGAWDNWNP